MRQEQVFHQLLDVRSGRLEDIEVRVQLQADAFQHDDRLPHQPPGSGQPQMMAKGDGGDLIDQFPGANVLDGNARYIYSGNG